MSAANVTSPLYSPSFWFRGTASYLSPEKDWDQQRCFFLFLSCVSKWSGHEQLAKACSSSANFWNLYDFTKGLRKDVIKDSKQALYSLITLNVHFFVSGLFSKSLVGFAGGLSSLSVLITDLHNQKTLHGFNVEPIKLCGGLLGMYAMGAKCYDSFVALKRDTCWSPRLLCNLVTYVSLFALKTLGVFGIIYARSENPVSKWVIQKQGTLSLLLFTACMGASVTNHFIDEYHKPKAS